MPKTALATRIENKGGGGVPDVAVTLQGLPFWLELKTTKAQTVVISPQQVAWHMAHYARGGLSFFLVRAPRNKCIRLYTADQGPDLARNGVLVPCVFEVYRAADVWEGLRPLLFDHYSRALRLWSAPCGPAPLPCGPANLTVAPTQQ